MAISGTFDELFLLFLALLILLALLSLLHHHLVQATNVALRSGHGIIDCLHATICDYDIWY